MKTAFIYFALSCMCLITAPVQSLAGGIGTGGGNWQEEDFVKTAYDLVAELETDYRLAEQLLGVRLDQWRAAMKTPVQCAIEPELSKMRGLHKQMYFEGDTQNIYLDCERYDDLQTIDPETKKSLEFHEYMRAAVGETSAYEVSSRLANALKAIRDKKHEAAGYFVRVDTPESLICDWVYGAGRFNWAGTISEGLIYHPLEGLDIKNGDKLLFHGKDGSPSEGNFLYDQLKEIQRQCQTARAQALSDHKAVFVNPKTGEALPEGGFYQKAQQTQKTF